MKGRIQNITETPVLGIVIYKHRDLLKIQKSVKRNTIKIGTIIGQSVKMM